jgi:hypothetical protein
VPFGKAGVPLKFAAVPLVFWLSVGTSAETSERNVGCAAAPVVGPAKTVLAVSVLSVSVSVPLPVTGEPEMVKMGAVDPSANATLVTVPLPPPAAAHAPSPRRNVELEHVPVHSPMTFADVAAAIAVPFASSNPVIVVVNVISGVVVEFATDPAKPFAVATATLVTVPDPDPPDPLGGDLMMALAVNGSMRSSARRRML